MVVKKNIAVIPARGGSKRILQKNIVDFGGVPMIAKTIESAMNSEIFDRIIVSTDDEKIADVSRKYGVEVPFFRQDTGDDFSTVSDATIEALIQAREYFAEEYDNVIQLMPNCPLRKSEDILRAYDNFIEKKNSFQISCFKFGWMNPWWAFKLSDTEEAMYLFENVKNKRSQDLDDLYCPTGAIWIAKYKNLLLEKTFYGSGYKMFPISWKSAIDIDDYDDLDMARTFLESSICK